MHKRSHPHRNVSQAMTEWRDGDGKHVKAVIEIHSEQSVGDQLAEILVGGGNDAHVDAVSMGTAEPLELLLLQHPQKLRLQLKRNIADFIQKECAAVGRLEAADLLRDGARRPGAAGIGR